MSSRCSLMLTGMRPGYVLKAAPGRPTKRAYLGKSFALSGRHEKHLPISRRLVMVHPPENSFDAAITRAYENGCEAHGHLGLEEDDFKSHVVRIVEKHMGDGFPASAAVHFIEALHTNDLYLGVACARRLEVAWNRFNATYRKYVEDLACFVTSTPDAAIELADNILVNLFLPNQSGQSRIASYRRAELAGYLAAGHSQPPGNQRAGTNLQQRGRRRRHPRAGRQIGAIHA